MPLVTALIRLPDDWVDDEKEEFAKPFNGSTYFGYWLDAWLKKDHDAELVTFKAGDHLT